MTSILVSNHTMMACNTFVDQEVAQQVAAGIAQSRCRELTFFHCFFEDGAQLIVANALREAPQLSSITMHACHFDENPSDFLERLSECRRLVKIDIERVTMQATMIQKLVDVLPRFEVLQSLTLTQCSLNDHDVELLANVFPRCFALYEVSVTMNTFGDRGSDALIHAYTESVSLKRLDVSPHRLTRVQGLRYIWAINNKPPSHMLVGLTLLRAGMKSCGALRSGKGLTQDERELILRLLEPWFGFYDTEKAAQRRARAEECRNAWREAQNEARARATEQNRAAREARDVYPRITLQ